jgi:hypothetical protein
MAADYEVALFALGLVGFLAVSAAVYYRTSDEYKLLKKRKELGYEVDSWWSSIALCCFVCLGPINRSRWERKHRFFKTTDYGKADRGSSPAPLPRFLPPCTCACPLTHSHASTCGIPWCHNQTG